MFKLGVSLKISVFPAGGVPHSPTWSPPISRSFVHPPSRKNPSAVDPEPNFYSPSSKVHYSLYITVFILEPHIAELL